LRKICADTDECGSSRVRPERFAPLRRDEQHRSDFLKLDDDLIGVLAIDVAQRVVSSRSAFRISRVEQVDGLAKFLAEAGCSIPILTLHVEDNDGILPA
jgi:hypothetical protein